MTSQVASGAMSAPVPPVERSAGVAPEANHLIAKYERIWGAK